MWEVDECGLGMRQSSFSNCERDLQVAPPKLSFISMGMGKEGEAKIRQRSFGIKIL